VAGCYAAGANGNIDPVGGFKCVEVNLLFSCPTISSLVVVACVVDSVGENEAEKGRYKKGPHRGPFVSQRNANALAENSAYE
jgi:hypothetical protein